MDWIFENTTTRNILLFGVGILLGCLLVAFVRGEKDHHSYPERWRRRALYLRYLSMAELAAVGIIVVLIVGMPKSGDATDPGVLGPTIVLGIIAAMMASVYRYIIRLGYFYEARADAIELLAEEDKTKPEPKEAEPRKKWKWKLKNQKPETKLDLKDKTNLAHFILLCKAISPDGLEYTEAESIAAELAKLKKDLLGKP